ncbi:helix-turn-helix domain-containing protein [Kordia sp.]|uniref:helix-turn-helix domain-containing protein n=1 Tax=Kordia sp. TaxID=1965332 RepID=UPI003D287FB7
MNNLLKTIFALLISIPLIAQEDNFITPDSLRDKGFSELEGLFYKSKIQSHDLIYSNTYHQKALKANDSIKIAKSYLFLTSNSKNDSIIEILIDKAIIYSKNKNDFLVPCTAYSMKASICKVKRQFKNALDYYLLTHKSSKRSGNTELNLITKYNIGVLKTSIGDYEEALDYFKAFWNLYGKDKKNSTKALKTYFALSNAYTMNSVLDSASYYSNLGINISKINNNERHYYRFVFLEGLNQYYYQNYEATLDSIKKSIPFLKKYNDIDNLAVAYSYIGKSYFKINRPKQSLFYLEKVDSIFNEIDHLLPRCRNSYKIIIDYYKNDKDYKKQLYYTNQLLKLDSVLTEKYINLNSTIYKEYETEEVISEKEKLIEILNEDNKFFSKYALILLILMSLFGIALGFNFYKRKKDQKRFNDIINKEQTNKEQRKNKKERINEIDEIIVQNVLSNLNSFEENKRYLDKGLSINELAKIVETNSKYLSIIINFHKQKTFSNYINDLRIDYIIKKIKQNKKYQKYNMVGLAEECGFSNRRSFSIAFNKRTKLSLKYFINELRKES